MKNQKKYHFLYITTCLITGKRYYGMHSTNDLNDGYLGSGSVLRSSIKKYGVQNHYREIYGDFFPDRETLRIAEAKLIDKERLLEPGCMNLIEGGSPKIDPSEFCGQSNPFFGKKHTLESRKKMSLALKGRKRSDEFKKKISKAVAGRKVSVETREKISRANSVSLLGRHHSQETRQKMSESQRIARAKLRENGQLVEIGRRISETKKLQRKLSLA